MNVNQAEEIAEFIFKAGGTVEDFLRCTDEGLNTRNVKGLINYLITFVDRIDIDDVHVISDEYIKPILKFYGRSPKIQQVEVEVRRFIENLAKSLGKDVVESITSNVNKLGLPFKFGINKLITFEKFFH